MNQSGSKKRVNVGAFLEMYERGRSEQELREKFGLKHSQLEYLVSTLVQNGKITDELKQNRTENLRINYGTEDGPLDPHRRAAVDLNTGLVVHCPSCGASVKRDSNTCEYCNSPLDFNGKGKTIPCPYCFTETPADGRYCISCATQIKDRVKDGLVIEERLCPRCDKPMKGRTVGDFSVIYCQPCQGYFIPHAVFEMIQERGERAFIPTDQIRNHPNEGLQQEIRYVRCPVCRKIMNRTNFGRISGVIIDTCRGHGLWFDQGEIEKIMNFIARGGIAKSKELEMQKLRDDEKLAKIRNIQLSRPANESYSTWDVAPATLDIVDVMKWLFGAR